MEFKLSTWVISDTHFGHKNIQTYCNRPKNHNTRMIDAWTRLVQPQDTILHLGDLCVWYGPTESNWHKKVAKLPGQKYMIRGNHDHRSVKDYDSIGIQIIEPFSQHFKLSRSDNPIRVLFTHEPDYPSTENWDLNIHGHSHNHVSHRPYTYINVSVEMMRYRPVKLRTILLANKGMVISNLLQS